MAAPAELSGTAPEPAAGEPPGAAVVVPQPAQEPPGAEVVVPQPAQEPPGAEVVAPQPAQELPEATATDPQAPAEALAGDGPAPDAQVAGEDIAAEVREQAPEPDQNLEGAEAGYAGGRRRTSRLAVAAVVFGVLALAGVAVIGLAIVTHGFRPKTVVTYRPAAVFRLQAGDCINSSPNGLAVTVLPCATPHQAEVFATFSLPGTSWPGSTAAQQQAGNGCASRIGGYLNPQLLTAGLSQQYVFPDQKAWRAGVRTVICEVSSSTGPLTGSVRQSG